MRFVKDSEVKRVCVGTSVEHGDDEGFVSRVANSQRYFSLSLIINDMKRFFKSFYKSKKPSLGGSIHVPGQAISISTLLTSTDLLPFFC